jgi:hypothetical protein
MVFFLYEITYFLKIKKPQQVCEAVITKVDH